MTEAIRDDIAAVHKALADSAATQRVWQGEYEAKAASLDGLNRALFERFAAQARGAANAFEVSADMIHKYVGRPGYTRVVDGVTT